MRKILAILMKYSYFDDSSDKILDLLLKVFEST